VGYLVQSSGCPCFLWQSGRAPTTGATRAQLDASVE
jgi:hypothetical protein